VSKLYETLDDSRSPITLLLKGDSGAGKTWKAAHFPKPCFINFDGNLVGLKQLPPEMRADIKVVNPMVDANGKLIPVTMFWKNFLTKLQLVLADPSIQTVVLDSLSTMADALQWQLLGSRDPMQKPKGYDFWAFFKNHILAFCDEVIHHPKLDKHIIVIAHDKVDKDELTGTVSRELSLDGSMKDRLSLHFSDVWECYSKKLLNGDVEYCVRTVPGANFTAKCSLPIGKDFVFDKEKPTLIAAIKAVTLDLSRSETKTTTTTTVTTK
jgi:hypothetical protein